MLPHPLSVPECLVPLCCHFQFPFCHSHVINSHFVTPTSSIPVVSIPTLSTFQIESMLLLGNQFPLSEAYLATFLASWHDYATEILLLKQHKHLLAMLAMLINTASKQ